MNRVLSGVLHIALGLGVIALLARVAAWGVPDAEVAIWWTALVVGIVVTALGVRQAMHDEN